MRTPDETTVLDPGLDIGDSSLRRRASMRPIAAFAGAVGERAEVAPSKALVRPRDFPSQLPLGPLVVDQPGSRQPGSFGVAARLRRAGGVRALVMRRARSTSTALDATR